MDFYCFALAFKIVSAFNVCSGQNMNALRKLEILKYGNTLQ